MKADYDSQADALSIDLISVERWDSGESVHDTYCQVSFAGDRLANVELLNPNDHLDLLQVAAERYSLDSEALIAAARAALAAPNRPVVVDVGGPAIA